MTGRRPDIAPNWYETAFDAMYPLVYAHRTVAGAKPEVGFAVKQLEIKSGQAVLDLCCGNGRHLVHLLKCTPRVVGLDYSRHMLNFAKSLVKNAVRLVRADMRNIPFTGAFDAVTNFFTSFGYFFTADENLEVARGVARALKPSGRFFIDYVNRANIEQTLVPQSVTDHDSYQVRETRWIDEQTARLNKFTEVYREGRRVGEATESVRLYTPDEFSGLLVAAGLRVEQFFGDYSGAPLGDSTPRMIAIGQKA
ncbi:MAG TPA: class I SAM-dependent methyltransferase [Candidatus Hydrogenedentes bacterium]|nr:class I SAM-dependent methyltransferase [Candidatus Hydrogenedentota bacterium]